MAVYTKRGDNGKTSLYDSQNTQQKRVSKSSKVISAIGAVDEANSYLGVAAAETGNEELRLKVYKLQCDLFTVGSVLAGAKLEMQNSRVVDLEKEIDRMEQDLPVQAVFILPGGDKVAAKLFYARALVRRAERAVISIPGTRRPSGGVLKYLNRLSDYLFILARWVNSRNGITEIKWKGNPR